MATNIASLLAPDPSDASGLIASQNPLGAPQAVLDYASSPPPVPTPPPTASQGYSAPMLPAVSAPRTSIPQLAPLAPPPAPAPSTSTPWRATTAAAPAPTFQDVRFAGSGASNAPLMDPKAIQAQDAARAGVGQAIGQQYEVGKGVGAAERAEGEAQARGGQFLADTANINAHVFQDLSKEDKAKAEDLYQQSKELSAKLNPTQDPNHWASTQSVGQKVGWVIANALGAFGGNNNSAEMMKSAIQNDLQAQQRSFENGKAQSNSLYKQAFDLTGNSRDALKLAMNAQLDQAKALAQSWADKYRGQTAGAKADAEVQKINTLISQNTLEGVQEHNKAFHYQPGSGPTLLSATPKFQAKLEELTKAWQANPANAGKPLPIEQLKMDAANLTPGGFGTQQGTAGSDYAKAGSKGAGVPRAVQSIAAHEDAAAKNLRDATEALRADNSAANRANYNAVAKAAGVEPISEWSPISPVRESTLDSNLALVQKRGARASANLAGNAGAGELPDYATRPDGE